MRRVGYALMCLVVAVSGCEDPVDRVVVEIRAPDLDVPAELDALVLTISASRTAEGDELCEPYEVTYTLDGTGIQAIVLPYSLELRPGDVYRHQVYVRVEGLLHNVLRFRTERMASLAGGDVRMKVALSPDCLDRGIEAGRHCLDGEDLEAPHFRIFDEGQYVVPGEACREE